MAYPKSSQVSPGDDALASQYNNLRDDALYPILQSFTYGETISVNDAVYLASDGKVYKTNASYNDERINNFIGFAKEAGNTNDIKKVQIAGIVEDFSGLTTGSYYYLSDTAGGINTNAGTYFKKIGIAISSTKLLIIKLEPITGYMISSDNLRISSDSEVYSTAAPYVIVKRIRIGRSGLVRIRFDLRSVTSGYTVYGKIHRNSSPYGTERTTTSNIYNTYTEDLYFSAGDFVELGIGTSPSTTAYARNFRLYYDVVVGDKVIF
jgi:hypothetical protein